MSEVALTQDQLSYILSPQAVRDKAQIILERTRQGQGLFVFHEEKLEEVCQFVQRVIQDNYPDMKIPYHSRWNHFQVGKIDRLSMFRSRLSQSSPVEKTKSEFDLVITSVLLDAGAGDKWSFEEDSSGKEFARSEGLAVASFHMFMSHQMKNAAKLMSLTEKDLETAFQVSVENPLNGLPGRLSLLHQLGECIASNDQYFSGGELARPGDLVDYFLKKYPDKVLPAPDILQTILFSLGGIWPGRLQCGTTHLGDTWSHSKLGEINSFESLVPFHKLSQWLSYSLIEPLVEIGFSITNMNEMTGLAEYRNGGLLIDTGLISLKNAELLQEEHAPSSELIIEWRALTVALLDSLANLLRKNLKMSETDFPLVKVLEGGTWWAGRKVAQQKRSDGSPPLQIQSDGTVF